MKKQPTLTLLLLLAAASAQAQSDKMLPEAGVPYTITSRTEAVGNGAEPKYQWFRDGVLVPGATGKDYTVPAEDAHGENVEFKRAAYVDGCDIRKFSNAIVVSWGGAGCNLLVNGTCWADANVDDYQTFAAKPDMYTKFYQWNRSTPIAATGTVTLNTTDITDPAWTVNPCPDGWRLPTSIEMLALIESGFTPVTAANVERGNSVPGSFFGENHATCALPDNMSGCIFIPAQGYRATASSVNSAGTLIMYTSSKQMNIYQAYMLMSNFSNGLTYLALSQKYCAYPLRCVK